MAATLSGTAIILFADIVDSTGLTERIGDTAFRDRARELDSVLRAAIRKAGGTPVEGKLLGDGILATTWKICPTWNSQSEQTPSTCFLQVWASSR